MGRVNKSSQSYIKTQADVMKAMSEVGANLNTVLSNMLITTEDQLKEVGIAIQNTSDMYAPMDTGDLIDSSYVETQRVGDKVVVEIGYTADHAPYVHENTPSNTDYKNPTTAGSHYKFLQRAVTETEAEIATILADALRNQLK